MELCTVTIMPDGARAQVPKETSLFDACAEAGVEIKGACGGGGVCNQCLVKVSPRRALRIEGTGSLRPEQIKQGYVLACQSWVVDDVVVEIPSASRVSAHRVLMEDEGLLKAGDVEAYPFAPVLSIRECQLTAPSLLDNASDWDRVKTQLEGQEPKASLEVIRKVPAALRKGDWRVNLPMVDWGQGPKVVRVEPGPAKTYGLAVDIGTTTVALSLIDMERGVTLGTRGSYNRQGRCGDDVISRIIHCSQPGGLEELQSAAVQTINSLITELVDAAGISRDWIDGVVVSANTTMSHLFLGIDPGYIRLEPYIPAFTKLGPFDAKEVGLMVNPQAEVYLMPSVASYVGGDVVAGVLFSRLHEQDELSLFVDIGTNGEMVLGSRDFLVSCACSAGPAFEGSGITCGTRAMEGAIEKVAIQQGDPSVQTIGGKPPVGICGSGLIDCLAKLQDGGIIDRTGQFVGNWDRLRPSAEGREFVLVRAGERGCQKDIVITEGDIKNLIRAKGAIYAGMRTLLRTLELDVDALDRVIIAGGFGQYLNVEDAIKIGLLPDIPRSKYEFLGNTSLKGARAVLLSREALAGVDQLAASLTYMELSSGNTFMDEFISACFLPHTDLSLFPSVIGKEVLAR
ncbi:MAG: ASKHA domain-containing protein [Limnochordia bacterium]|jgi:uncharacterized 2Fe-2S/4Fe-4S cluster protein (DUF4445 family)